MENTNKKKTEIYENWRWRRKRLPRSASVEERRLLNAFPYASGSGQFSSMLGAMQREHQPSHALGGAVGIPRARKSGLSLTAPGGARDFA